MSVKLLTEHHLEFLSLKRGCTGLSESTLVKMPHYWKSRVTAHMIFCLSVSLCQASSSGHYGPPVFSYLLYSSLFP